MSPKESFLEELNIFRNEVESALKFLYTELSIHAIGHKDKKVFDSINTTPIFWNTILNALQHSTFITLGRIFDIGSDHSIHVLRKLSENNIDLFSKESFKNRWLKDDDRKKVDHWLPGYIDNLYVPSVKDFRKFRLFIAQQQKIYEKIYRPVRDHFGHKKYSKNEDVKVLFDRIQIRELEKFCVQLKNIHESLWQLYHNGRGPLLPIKQGKYSTQSILKTKFKPYVSKPINAYVIEQAKLALDLLKLGKLSKK